MAEGKRKGSRPELPGSFTVGAIALAFLIIGYEVAVFVHKAAVTRIEANRDRPDTVYVYVEKSAGRDTLPSASLRDPVRANAAGRVSLPAERHNAPHSAVVNAVREASRRVESFRFNPNTVSVEDLQRLGFSLKQAQAIDNYRQKGGRFRRKEDFAKSYVVADSVFSRLEKYIDIPLLDINTADSLALLELPGIGPFYAGKIVSYRESLRGYSHKEQLMDIYRFDREKYDGLRDLIMCSQPEPYPLWILPEAELSLHPYISRTEAHSIVLYREHHAPGECTVEALQKTGALSQEHAASLGRCRIAPAAQ